MPSESMGLGRVVALNPENLSRFALSTSKVVVEL